MLFIFLLAPPPACRAATSILIIVDSGTDATLQQRLLDDDLLGTITPEHLFQVTRHWHTKAHKYATSL